jgi:hypothetical protein
MIDDINESVTPVSRGVEIDTAVVRKVERKAGQARRYGKVCTFRRGFNISDNRCKVLGGKAENECP